MSCSILDYFSNKNGLPDTNGGLSSQLPFRVIALAINEVVSVLQQNDNSVKRQRGSYLQPVSELSYLLDPGNEIVSISEVSSCDFIIIST